MARRAKPIKDANKRYSHNDAKRDDKRSTYAIEQSEVASRKSTRGSSNRAKTDATLRLTAVVKNRSAKARSGRQRNPKR